MPYFIANRFHQLIGGSGRLERTQVRRIPKQLFTKKNLERKAAQAIREREQQLRGEIEKQVWQRGVREDLSPEEQEKLIEEITEREVKEAFEHSIEIEGREHWKVKFYRTK